MDIFIILYPAAFCLISTALFKPSLIISNLSVIYTLVSKIVLEPNTVILDAIKSPLINVFPSYTSIFTLNVPSDNMSRLFPFLIAPLLSAVAAGNLSEFITPCVILLAFLEKAIRFVFNILEVLMT